MFIYVISEFESRPTRDMDFMILSLPGGLGGIRNVMEEICSVSTGNDYMRMEVTGAEQISIGKKYPGVKTKFIGRINNVRVPFSVDVGIDDVIVPKAQLRKAATQLKGFEEPLIYTYSLESTIAEKFDAILKRMETTSRMKDFFDIYYLSDTFDFDGALLKDAVEKTVRHRGRELEDDVFYRISKFAESDFFRKQWSKFEPAFESGLSFGNVLKRLSDFLEPIYVSILHETEFNAEWQSGRKKWTGQQ